MIRTTLGLIAIFCFSIVSSAQTGTIGPDPRKRPQKTISSTEADGHILQRVQPVVPPLAKAAKVGGKVKLNIVILPTGEVVSIRVVSGHPMVVAAAVEAVKKWKYKPFVEGGVPIAVATDVELDFPGGMSEHESEVRNKFFPIEEECRKLLNSGKYADAEQKCREAVAVSNELPKDVVLERSMPRSLLAHSILLQGRVAEAIPIYEEALALDKGYLKSNDADLATDYANVARAYTRMGELTKADGLYVTSISTFEAAIQNLPQMKENYTRRLKRTIDEYSQLKEAQGQKKAAEELRKKAR